MIFEVATALKALVGETLAELYQHQPDGPMITPRISIGVLPVDSAHDDYPYVIIQPTSGQWGDDQNLVEIALKFGVHNEDDDISQGFLDLSNMITRTWLKLVKVGYLAGRFELIKPITWKMGDEDQNQPLPHFIGSMECKFKIPAVLLDYETVDDVRLFGNGYGID